MNGGASQEFLAGSELPEVPAFRSHLTIDALDGDGLLAHGERTSRVFTGAIFSRLAGLVDGVTSTDTIVDRLESLHPAAEVYYAVLQLVRAGVAFDALEVGGHAPTRTTPFRLRVVVDALDEESAWVAALHTHGLDTGTTGDIRLVATSHHLDQRLASVNAAALLSGQPWLLCSCSGTMLWLGPRFLPGTTACWECLRHRLAINLPVDAWLVRRAPERAPIPPAGASWSHPIAAGLIAAQLRRLAAGETDTAFDDAIVTLDTVTMIMETHRLQRRPQCPACGDPNAYAAQVQRAVELTSQPKRFTGDGGHRAQSPEATIARLSPLIDSLTGVVTSLRRTSDASAPLHVYTAGNNLARPTQDFAGLRRALRRNSGGKGFSDAQARASALGEGVERYSGFLQGDEPRVRASMMALSDTAIHPNACMGFSIEQYAARESLNANAAALERIPAPFDPEATIDWTPVWSLTRASHVHLPTSLLYYGYAAAHSAVCFADSNGNAAGGTREDAILQGFFELVERDATGIWWYNRIPRPAVDLSLFLGEAWPGIRNAYEKVERELWVLDLTTDLGIPVFAAVSRRLRGPNEMLLLGLGAHLDARLGIMRAISELHQMLVTVDTATATAGTGEDTLDPEVRVWLTNHRLTDHPFLAPTAARPRVPTDYNLPQHDDLREDVLWCQEVVERHGLELHVLDQTRPDVDVPVFKVIVPGLRHFRARFAPGRLYDVPVAKNWLQRTTAQESLNPVPFFL